MKDRVTDLRIEKELNRIFKERINCFPKAPLRKQDIFNYQGENRKIMYFDRISEDRVHKLVSKLEEISPRKLHRYKF
jgi:hypothetical protein